MNKIYKGDNLEILRTLPDESIDLIYIDPPFNTGKKQKRTSIRTIRDENGDRKGFQGNTYKTIEVSTQSYDDSFDNDLNGRLNKEKLLAYQMLAPHSEIEYLELFLRPRLLEAHRLLKDFGSLYFHIDPREVHYSKILLDNIFGRENFINEIIWAYDFGGRSRSRWPAKHDNILFYVKDREKYIFNQNAVDRIEYMAPGLVGPEKAKRGKVPTDTWWWSNLRQSDTWWMSIVGTNSKERTGYPTQKPVQLINRIIKASTLPGVTVLDFFAGSGTTGESCLRNNRNFILIDNNDSSLQTMAKRFSKVPNIEWEGFDPSPLQIEESELARFLKNPDDNILKSNKKPNEDFQFLASRASDLQEGIEEKYDLWKKSPFEWIIQLPARTKGKVARQLLLKWFSAKGLNVQKGTETSETLQIGQDEYALKFSTLWTTHIYKFQQIKENGPDKIICFGLSPLQVHCWIIDKSLAIENGNPQHKGSGNSEYWISVDPEDIPDWINKFGGTLEQATRLLNSRLE